MSSQIINLIAKKALKDTALKNINAKDPFFENTPVIGRDGRPTGKVKRQKKGVPAGLSQNDGEVLQKVRKRAYWLDMSLFNCCGIKFGWSALVAIIPVVGDFIDMVMAYFLVRTCAHIDGGLPAAIQSRMYFNVILDFAVGLIPFIGDIADALFRANTRNAWILEEYLTKKAETERTLQAENPGTGESGASLLKRPDAIKMLSSGWRKALLSADKTGQGDDEEMGLDSMDGHGHVSGGRRGGPSNGQHHGDEGVETGVSQR